MNLPQALSGLGRGIAGFSLGAFLLAGCTATPSPPSGLPRTAASSNSSMCSVRATIHLRAGPGMRGDFELMDIARRAGVQMDVMQTISRTTRMVTLRGFGSPTLCEEAIEELRLDPRIESIDTL